MTTEKVKRKLTAILSADVKGYSRLMGVDEVGTIRTLETYRKVISDLIQKKGGRVVDSPGDNVLAEFASVVDALESAVEIQRELKVRNEDLSESRRMEFRMGINLGDVVEEGERIYGDGVNIAARIEGLAEGGGICISGTAFDQIGKRLAVGYEYLGEQAVKNIEKPVRVYRVLMEPEAAGKVIGEARPKRITRRFAAVAVVVAVVVIAAALAFWHFHLRPPPIEPAKLDKMALPLPDKPSIAVLPFVNMSDDPKQELFCDGLTDNIITSLSRIPHLFVIASNSTFTYKGKPVKVQQVAEDLGVRYVLEGSIQKSEKKVRVRAQLIDAINGRHMWAESYDRSLEDIFALQDEITSKVITSLQVELTSGEYARAIGKSTKNLEALELWWRGQYHLIRVTKEDNTLARQYAEKAIEIDPGFSTAWTELGFTHVYDSMFGWSSSREQSLKLSEECAQKALSLNPSEPKAFMLLCSISLAKKENDKAVEYAEKAVEANPNDPWALYFLGNAMRWVGRFEEAIANVRKSMRLTPYYPAAPLVTLGYSSFHLRRYDDALSAGEKLLERCRKGEMPDWFGYLLMVATYAELGQEEKARLYAAEILKTNPNWNLEVMKRVFIFKNQSDLDRLLNAARKTGLPEKPPLPLPDKPSIAVLPFVNMSDDKSQEFFSDGLSEEIITALSKNLNLFVIARNSSFVYKGKPVNVQQVSRELGVRYVLEGSVRKAENQVRITAQLIDATTGNHLWAERYDCEIKDIFTLQEKVALEILKALDVKLTYGEGGRTIGKGTSNLEAYLKFLEARELTMQLNRESNFKARQLAEEVIRLDPQFPSGHLVLAAITSMDVWLGISKSPRESMMKAIELAQKAISLDDSLALAHAWLGFLYANTREYEKGLAEGARAIEMAPNLAEAHAYYAFGLNYTGRPEEALAHSKVAFRLNPVRPPAYYYTSAALAYRLTGQYENAVKMCREVLSRWPNQFYGHIELVMSYMAWERDVEARAAAQDLLRIDPKFSAQRYAQSLSFKEPALTAQALELMRKAGLPN